MTEHKQWYFRYRMTGGHFAEPLAMRLAVNALTFSSVFVTISCVK